MNNSPKTLQEGIRKAFDLLSASYDEYSREIDYDNWVKAYAVMAEAILGRPPQSVLDIGCGTGNSSIPWTRCCSQVFGIDLSHKMLRAAFAKDSAVAFVQGSLFQLPFQDSRFQVAQIMFSVANLFSIDQLTLCLKEVARVLMPQGIFFVDFLQKYPYKEPIICSQHVVLGGPEVRIEERGGHFTQIYSTAADQAELSFYPHLMPAFQSVAEEEGLVKLAEIPIASLHSDGVKRTCVCFSKCR